MILLNKRAVIISLLAFSLFLGGCNTKPEKIVVGKDNCAECKMTIMDTKFGAEIITKKGKIYKFDDAQCVATFFKRRGVELSSIRKTLFVDYNTGEFVEVKKAEFLVSSLLKSPMGGNAAAFKNKRDAEKKAGEIENSRVTNWATLYNILIK